MADLDTSSVIETPFDAALSERYLVEPLPSNQQSRRDNPAAPEEGFV